MNKKLKLTGDMSKKQIKDWLVFSENEIKEWKNFIKELKKRLKTIKNL